MKLLFFSLLFVGFIMSSNAQSRNWDEELSMVNQPELYGIIVSTHKLVEDKWAELPQTQFWANIMRLAPDSCLVNIASSRTVIEKKSLRDWNRMNDFQKEAYKDSVRCAYNMDSTDKIYVTTGKKDFYRFTEVYPSLTKGILAFEENNVDPWYAQAILLIESPAQLKKSSAGAYGPFQLMPGVARAQGLTVNRYTDERSSFERSAYAASRLIKTVCIPSAKQILTENNYTFNENDWWFRLFVLHVYHAGAGNVRAVVEKISHTQSGEELIRQMWQTKAAQFGNNSQNYSQLALAAQYIIHEMTSKTCTNIFDCQEEEEVQAQAF